MSKSSDELIFRYLEGIATQEETRELEFRLLGNEQLLDEFLLQAELDAHLRQEAQSPPKFRHIVNSSIPHSPRKNWKWIPRLSTFAALIIASIILFKMLPQQEALAYPTLGNLFIEIPQPEKNIWAAAFKGDIDEIRWELKKSVSVNLKAKCGLAPLHIATLANHPAAVKLLLENGADVSLADSEGNTALHMASFLVRTEIVRLLMKSGADETQRNHRGFSSIDNLAIKWSAGLEEYYHHIERKLQIKLDLNQIRRERPKTLRLLVSESLSTLDQTPDVSLWQAAITGNTAAVEQHILAGTDINAKEDFGGSTPLILAAIFGQEQVVAILIEAGADLNARNNTGGTAIHQACFFCRPAILEQLLKAGADPWVVNGYGLTPLGVVTREWNTELKGIYFYIYKSLHLPFDSESVRRTRDEIAETLKRFRDS